MFRPVKILNAPSNIPETVHLPTASATAYHAGDALVLSEGVLAHASATKKPTFIAACDKTEGKDTLPVYPVTPDMILETVISASPTALKLGDTVTLTVTDGAAVGVSATKENGVATLTDLCGAVAVGDTVRVRFA